MTNIKLMRRWAASLGSQLGLRQIPLNTRRFILTHFMCLLSTTIPGVFINTFFFRQDGKMLTIALFNAVTVFGMALVMQLSSHISLKKSPVFVLRIGIVFFNLFYILLLLLQNQAVRYMPLLAAFNALANGFYWQGYNELMKLCTTEEILDRTVSLMGLAGAVITLIVPVLSGLLITGAGARWGYFIIFCLSFGFSLYTAFLSTRIDRVKFLAESDLGAVYRRIFSNRRMFLCYLAELFRGVRNTALPVLYSIVFFKLVTNEAVLGVNNMACGLLAVASFVIAGKVVRGSNRMRFILLATVLSALFSVPFFFSMNPVSLFALSMVNAFLTTYIDNPGIALFYSAFGETSGRVNFAQIMASHEVFYAVGRVAGLSVLVALSGSFKMLALAVLLLNLTPLLTWALYGFALRLPPEAESA